MIRVGKIVATHGVNGAVILTHIVGNSKWLKKETVLMVEMHKGSYIPHFVSQCKANGDEEYIVNIEDVDKVESAKKLVTKHVYVDEKVLTGYEKKSPLLWIGFSLIDKKEGEIGKIEDVMQTGNQWLAKVNYNEIEVLVPLIEQTIEFVDIKQKKLHAILPEGLLEVYTNL